MTNIKVGDRVKALPAYGYDDLHGIVASLRPPIQGLVWAIVRIPDSRVGYEGRCESHPVWLLQAVDDDPPGWLFPEERR